MKKIFSILFLFIFLSPIHGELEDYTYVPLRRKLMYVEEFYSLYRENMYRGTENLNANVFWLEHALKAPFAPPVQAFSKIETPAQWDKYKKLFYFQIYFLMMESYLRIGERYEKNNIFFFNYTYYKEIKEGLEITKIYYKRAEYYWQKVLELAKVCWKIRDIELLSLDGETDKWQDRVYRIINNNIEVNYSKEIKERLKEVDRKLTMLSKGEYKR